MTAPPSRGLLARVDALAPDAVLIEDERGSWTTAAVRDQASRTAAALHGLPPGARFAVLAKNRAAYVAAYLAAAWTGAVIVPLNGNLTPTELRWQLDHAHARLVLCGASHAAVLAPLRADGPTDREWRCFDAVDGWDGLPEGPAPTRAEPDPHRPIVQMYTSGTTGRPKGALLTEANLLALVDAWLTEMPLAPGDRTLQVTPLFHVGALMMVLCNLSAGATLVLPPEFTPGGALRALRERGVTHTLMVPAMIRWLLMEAAAGPPAPLAPTLRALVYGAAPMPTALLTEAAAALGCDLLQGYGLTETAGVLTVLRPDDHRAALAAAFSAVGPSSLARHPAVGRPDLALAASAVPEPAVGPDPAARLRAAGRPLRCCEIRVVDRDGNLLPPGEAGEVIARGANITPGYADDPQATAEALRDGWFHTGDVGYLDADGYLFLVDRLKDMILVGGENVYSREVEEALEAHPAVREVAVVGAPHPVFGEEVVAFVVADGEPGALARELIRHCRQRLARYKCPTRVELRPALPRNAAGKLKKSDLRAPLWATHDRPI